MDRTATRADVDALAGYWRGLGDMQLVGRDVFADRYGVSGMGEYTLHLGDCLEVMRGIEDNSIDLLLTDPPYGCGKADWDDAFPTAWYNEARRVAKMVGIITGASGLKDSVPLVGEDFIDVISARNLNGMTRSPAGFGNWIACVLAKSKPPQGVTFFEFVVGGDMPNHPSPKPIDYMRKLVARLTKPGDTVLDCFAGSGSTGVACILTGRKFIGIEIDARYHALALRRMEEAALQMPLLAL